MSSWKLFASIVAATFILRRPCSSNSDSPSHLWRMVDGEPLHAPSPRLFLSSMPCFNLVLRKPHDLSVKHNFIDKSPVSAAFVFAVLSAPRDARCAAPDPCPLASQRVAIMP